MGFSTRIRNSPGVRTRGVDAVLIGDDLPELGTDLVAALAGPGKKRSVGGGGGGNGRTIEILVPRHLCAHATQKTKQTHTGQSHFE
jgi:hypothetical protein